MCYACMPKLSHYNIKYCQNKHNSNDIKIDNRKKEVQFSHQHIIVKRIILFPTSVNKIYFNVTITGSSMNKKVFG